jgi:hypothetical protein
LGSKKESKETFPFYCSIERKDGKSCDFNDVKRRKSIEEVEEETEAGTEGGEKHHVREERGFACCFSPPSPSLCPSIKGEEAEGEGIDLFACA